MKVGPDIATIGALVGDPARANMLTALLGGQALTAGELAREAGVTAQTASSHLSQSGSRRPAHPEASRAAIATTRSPAKTWRACWRR